MKEKRVVAGVNVIACDCGGTIYLPVTMEMMAILRVRGPRELTGVCKPKEHEVKVKAYANPPMTEDGVSSMWWNWTGAISE